MTVLWVILLVVVILALLPYAIPMAVSVLALIVAGVAFVAYLFLVAIKLIRRKIGAGLSCAGRFLKGRC